MAAKFESLLSVQQRLALFSVLLLLTLSLALAISALLSDFWIQAESMRRNGTESAHNQINSGLFFGVRQLEWAFVPRRKSFSVYDELKSNVGFMERNVWFGLLLSAGLGLLWNIVAIFVALRNATLEDQKNERTALGPMGICLWSLLNALSYGLCLLLFQHQFQSQIQANVLLPEEIAAGFSSKNCIRLGFSFFLMSGAFIAQLSSLVFMYGTLRFCRKKGSTKEKTAAEEKPQKQDDSAFIY